MDIAMQTPTGEARRRVSGRKRVLMTATIFTPEGALSVRVRDLSAGGANVSANQSLPNPCDLIFKRGPLFAAGRLVWSDENEGGIRFYRYLTPAEIAASHAPVVTR